MVRVTDFLRDPRGSMTQTGLVFVLLTLLAGGVSVDVMRHEGTRSRVQKALDACTANVAAMQRPRDSVALLNDNQTLVRDAVSDCMTRAGLGARVSGVTATSSGGFGNVAATATGTQTNQFMQMLNRATTAYNGASSAVLPAGGAVEVILAYEATNAMTTSALVAPFRSGATAFVDALLATDTANAGGMRTATSVGLVPYTDGVNMPAALMARYSVTNLSNLLNANCIDIPTAAFSTAAMSTTTSVNSMVPVDLATTTTMTSATLYLASNSTTAATAGTSSAACPAYTANILRTPTNAAATVKGNIATSQFFGGLRWDHGMHWASAMLDSGTNAAISPFLPATLAGRPLAYNTANAQKVIVFVNRSGSGSNVADGSHLMLATAFASGTSPIWRNAAVPALYCIDLPARTVSPKSFRPDVTGTAAWINGCNTLTGYTRLTWPQVWASVRAQWVAWQLYARGMQTTATPTLAQVQARFAIDWASMQQTLSFATQTSQFLSECAAAKANGVVIYTVALAAVARAKTPLQTCATSPAHHFDTTSAGFGDTMKVIAQTINQQAYSQ